MSNRKRVFVTGAGAGIGRAIAFEFARNECDVFVTDSDPNSARAVSDELTAFSAGRVEWCQADVRAKSDIEESLARMRDAFGGLDVAVNNAGVSTMAAVADLAEDEWDYVMDVNAKGVFLCAQAQVRAMVHAREPGCIINIASAAGKRGSPFLAHYCASKFAVIGLSQSLALEVAHLGIRVNCVCPGYVRTAMQDREVAWSVGLMGKTADEIRREYLAQVPLGRLSQPADVANVVSFLASDAAGYMTGQAINVTGGELMT